MVDQNFAVKIRVKDFLPQPLGGPGFTSGGRRRRRQCEAHEGVCKPIVESGLQGRAKAHLVLLAPTRRTDLFMGDEYGIGWRQGPAQKDHERHRQFQPPNAHAW
jgi:hypothetical protein